MITPTKICTICKLTKDLNQFTPHGGHRDGLGSNCRACRKELARLWRQKRKLTQTTPDAPQPIKATKPPIPQKSVPNVDSEAAELIVDLPGIWEIQNRGKGYTTFNFTSPIDQTTFTFSSFKEARKARESMRGVFVQQARYESVQRQSTTGKKQAVDDEDGE